jgi:hypothetical protein
MNRFIISICLVTLSLCVGWGTAFAGSTSLTFTGPVTESVIPSGDANPVDDQAVFSGYYEEGDLRVRPNGGIWYVAGDLGDAVNHLFSQTMPGWSQYLAVQRISGGTPLIGGEFLVKSLLVQSTANETLTLDVVGQNEDGNLLWQYWVTIPAGTTPVLVRLDTQTAVRGSATTAVNRLLIGALGATGVRVLEVAVDPKDKKIGGGKRGR